MTLCARMFPYRLDWASGIATETFVTLPKMIRGWRPRTAHIKSTHETRGSTRCRRRQNTKFAGSSTGGNRSSTNEIALECMCQCLWYHPFRTSPPRSISRARYISDSSTTDPFHKQPLRSPRNNRTQRRLTVRRQTIDTTITLRRHRRPIGRDVAQMTADCIRFDIDS